MLKKTKMLNVNGSSLGQILKVLGLIGVLAELGCGGSLSTDGSGGQGDAGDASTDTFTDVSPDTTEVGADGSSDALPDTKIDSGPIQYGIPRQSCAGGLDCRGVDCCEQRLVIGGSFPMGRSENGTDAYAGGDSRERPEHNATVDSFYLDTFEVTVGRFRKFVQAYDGTSPPVGSGDHHGLGAGWQSAWDQFMPSSQARMVKNMVSCSKYHLWTDDVGANEKMAINCASWYEAMAFCVWDGGRLPTEAEWEYAAAGGSENRLFPWGATEPDPDQSLAACNGGAYDIPNVEVGGYPKGKGKWGNQDLAGGLSEWVMDWMEDSWYTHDGNNCDNCANVAKFNTYPSRVLRGGNWMNSESYLRAVYRPYLAPTTELDGIGFRCARSPQ